MANETSVCLCAMVAFDPADNTAPVDWMGEYLGLFFGGSYCP